MTAVNAYSVTRFGQPTKGILLAENVYKVGALTTPSVAVGRFGIRLDAFAPCNRRTVKGRGFIDLVEIKSLTQRSTQRSFTVFKQPDTIPPYLVIFTNWSSTIDQVERLDPKYAKASLNVHQGVVGGEVVQQSDSEAIVRLVYSQPLFVFFADGSVRHFTSSVEGLGEVTYSTAEQFVLRACLARELIRKLEYQEAVVGLVRGVVDLMYLSTVYDHRGIGRLIRTQVISAFFSHVPRSILEVLQPELEKAGRDLGLVREMSKCFR